MVAREQRRWRTVRRRPSRLVRRRLARQPPTGATGSSTLEDLLFDILPGRKGGADEGSFPSSSLLLLFARTGWLRRVSAAEGVVVGAGRVAWTRDRGDPTVDPLGPYLRVPGGYPTVGLAAAPCLVSAVQDAPGRGALVGGGRRRLAMPGLLRWGSGGDGGWEGKGGGAAVREPEPGSHGAQSPQARTG